MASLPNQPPIVARVDNVGRLVAADQRLLARQERAGAKLGGALAVPQLASLARLAARLGVTITRPVMAASEEVDLDLLVRAEPDTDGVTLSIENGTHVLRRAHAGLELGAVTRKLTPKLEPWRRTSSPTM